MSYAVKNLRDLEDLAAKHGFGESQEARFAREDLSAEDTGLAYHVVRPGKRLTPTHRHKQAEEIYVVISGSGRAKLDDEVVELQTLDAVRIAPPVVRGFEAGDAGLELLVFGPHHSGDAEMVQGHWEE
jgi:mannose-6-phosphate isomerase-like protein (cupin superfamily)